MQQRCYLWQAVPLGAWGSPEEEQPPWLLLELKEQARRRRWLPSCLGQNHTCTITGQTELQEAKENYGMCSSIPAVKLFIRLFGYRFT